MQHAEATKKELLALEKQYWNAIKNADAAVATSLSDDTALLVGAQGVSELSRPTLRKIMESATYELKSFELEDFHMRQLSDDVVALAYKVSEDLVLDGKKIELEAYESSVWVRRDGKWVCAVHTESIAGDPFGRH